MSILKLPTKVKKLSPKDRALFNRFYDTHLSIGRLKLMDSMFSFPVSILEKSRISLIIPSSKLAEP